MGEGADLVAAVPRLSIDAAAMHRVVGHDALARGRVYADRGAVVAVSTVGGSPAEGTSVLAHVQGTARRPYLVSVRHFPGGRVEGACTCPVARGCKHLAAVLLTLARSEVDAGAAEWQRALAPLHTARHVQGGERQAPMVALQLEVRGTVATGLHFDLRPVVRRRLTDRWTRTGIGWRSIAASAYLGVDIPAAVRALLVEVVALSGRLEMYGYHGTDPTISLDQVTNRRLWDVLADLQRAGVPIVHSGADAEPVSLLTEPARATVDVVGSDAGWTLRPAITAGDQALRPGAMALLGQPAAAVAWWASAHDDGKRTRLHDLRLAPLERVVPPAVRGLVTSRSEITVPAGDRDAFLRDYYPALRRLVTLTSSDDSVTFPEETTRLALRVAHRHGEPLRLEWRWEHRLDDVVRTGEAGPGLDGEVGDPESRQAILQALSPHLDRLGTIDQGRTRSRGALAGTALFGSEVVDFARDVLPALREIEGVDVVMTGDPLDLREAEGDPVITVSGEPDGADWFDLHVSVSVDGEEVAFGELFRALAVGERHLLLPSGTYFALDRPELARLRTLIDEASAIVDDRRPRALRVSRYQVSLWEDLEELGVVTAQARAWSETVRRLRSAVVGTDAEPPASLRASLRPYQRAGYSWLRFLHDHGLGGVLADDMGLGKTVQAIALICHAREQGAGPPFLVVAPTSVVGNWAAECTRFAPTLATVVIRETGVRRADGASVADLVRDADVVVTSYALFRMEYDDYSALPWSGLILDEAQSVKNHRSKTYALARTLGAPFKLALTGTPMENNLLELWSVLSITAPGLFPSITRFTDEYRTPIERAADAEALDRLRRRIKPLMLRRTKEEVAPELPAKLEQVIELELNPRHRRVYDTYLQRERQKVLGLLGDVRRNRFEILRSLTLLRQASIDAALVDARHHAVPSTKTEALMEQLVEIVAEGHRVLVFSQFTRYLARVRTALDAAGIDCCYLDGATRRRDAVIDAFRSGSVPVFLISLKAGGLGLTLTEADYCIVLDPWWNPATEAQAVDRAHRIGQTRRVMVYRLVAAGTIEEKVMALKASKGDLVRRVLDGGGAGGAALTAEDVRALLE